MRSKLAAAAVLGWAIAGLAAPANAETYRIKIGAGHPPNALWISSIKDVFIARVNDRLAKETKHKIEWTEGWGGSLCKIGECLEAVESGLLDMAELQSPFEPSKLLAHNFAYFAPFGAGDPRVAAKAASEVYEELPALKKVLEDRYNQVYVATGVVGNYGLATNFKWKTAADLKGHKIAAAGPNLPWLQGTGVVGVQSNLNEAYTSMQSGVYEAWVMYPDALVSFKLNEVIKQYVDVDFGSINTCLLTINKDTWKDLPAEVKKIILEAGREWSDTLGRLTWERQEAGRKKLADLGVEVSQADMSVKQAWAKALPNIAKQRFEEINKAGMPGEVVYTYIKKLKAAGHVFPRDWEAER